MDNSGVVSGGQSTRNVDSEIAGLPQTYGPRRRRSRRVSPCNSSVTMYGDPLNSPTWKIETILGWLRAAVACASSSNRRRRSGSYDQYSRITLIATSRFNDVSRARYTSPIPPEPSGEIIS
jgi:hypothetical protein